MDNRKYIYIFILVFSFFSFFSVIYSVDTMEEKTQNNDELVYEDKSDIHEIQKGQKKEISINEEKIQKRELEWGIITAFNMINWSDHHRYSQIFLNPYMNIHERNSYMDVSIRFLEKSRSWGDLPGDDYGKSFEIRHAMAGLKTGKENNQFWFGLGIGMNHSDYGKHFIPVLYQSPVLPQEIYLPVEYFESTHIYKGGFIEYIYSLFHIRVIWDMEFYSSPRPEFKSIWIESEWKNFGSKNLKNSILLQGSASGFNILNPREEEDVKLNPVYGVGLEYALKMYDIFQIYAGGGTSSTNYRLYHSGLRFFVFHTLEASFEVQYNSKSYAVSDIYKKDLLESVEIIQNIDVGYEIYMDISYVFFDMMKLTIFIDRHESMPWNIGLETRFEYIF